MSTLKVTNIQATGETASRAVSGVAAAWASIDQTSTGHPTYDSVNISSTSDNATGKTSITFSSSMDNANYALAGAGQADGTSGAYFSTTGKSGQGSDTKMTASSFVTDNRNSAGSGTDLKYMSFSVHGDLA